LPATGQPRRSAQEEGPTDRVSKPAVKSIYHKPSETRRTRFDAGYASTDIPLGIDHAEDEQSKAGGHNGDHFEREDPTQLVWSEEGEGDMCEPIEEEGNELLCAHAN
jgi:hypothetical protein